MVVSNNEDIMNGQNLRGYYRTTTTTTNTEHGGIEKKGDSVLVILLFICCLKLSKTTVIVICYFNIEWNRMEVIVNSDFNKFNILRSTFPIMCTDLFIVCFFNGSLLAFCFWVYVVYLVLTVLACSLRQ